MKRTPVLLYRLVAWGAVAGALACAFALYLRPEFVVSLADRVWSCF
jgi:hypothetical protein